MGKTLKELRQLTDAEEYPLWHAYEVSFGLPLSRIEATVAIAGSAYCQTMGAKIQASDLIPQYEAPKPLTYKQGSELFAAFAAQHNKKQSQNR